MKRMIKAASEYQVSQSAKNDLFEGIAYSIMYGLSIDILQLKKYPVDQWHDACLKIYESQVKSSVHEILSENEFGVYIDNPGILADEIWWFIKNDENFIVDMDESLEEFK